MAAVHGLQCGLAALMPILAGAAGYRVSQAAKSEPFQTPADKFTDVVRQDDPAHCADGGVTSTQFAPAVGPVQWRKPDIAASVNDRARQHIHR